MKKPAPFLRRLIGRRSPVSILLLGYASYVLLGWLLLSLPVSRTGGQGSLDLLFTATSAVSTTGLSTLSTGSDFTRVGQIVILLLIQLGGIGYMTFGSFVVLARGRRISQFRQDIAKQCFALPDGIGLLHFLRSVIVFTIVLESLGAVALYNLFSRAGIEDAVFQAVFHSVSAFCTAGFSLFDDSLIRFASDFWVQFTVGVLSLCGALGFIVFTDLWDVARGGRERTTLTTRIIVRVTAGLVVLSALGIFLGNGALQELPPHERLMAAGFQSIYAITTVGFNSYPISALSLASTTAIVGAMVIGASPSGTGGGIKVTSVTALWAVTSAGLRGQDQITFWGCEVPRSRIFLATSATALYLVVLFASVYVLTLTESQPFGDLLFEATSALGTVGLSRGATSELTPLGKLTILIVMFLGRVGPLSLASALLIGSPEDVEAEEPDHEEDLAV